MNVYDFDKTVFYPDSSCSFVLYCLRRYPAAVLRVGPKILSAGLRRAFGAIRTKELKETVFSFLRFLPEPEKAVACFWDERLTGIGDWYLAQRRPDDLVITASPEFLVAEASRRLGFRLLGTRMDIRTGRIEGENCHDTEKVRRFRKAYPDEEIESFYSDSLSDQPLAEISREAFLVKKGKLSEWK